MKQHQAIPLVLLSLLLWPACSRSAPAVDTDDPWVRDVIERRTDKDREFRTSATSPLAGIQFLKSKPGNAAALTRDDQGRFGLTDAEDGRAILRVTESAGTWSWHREAPDVVAEKAGQPLADGAALDRSVTFAIERFTISVYPQSDTVTFKVFDAQRPGFSKFKQLEYYPPDRRYAVSATLVKTAENDAVTLLTSQNLEKTFYRYARIGFQIDGKDQALTAYKYALSGDGSDQLFIPFKDATSGKETYGAGRYLDLEEPDTASFVLDLNDCYNPLCNYSSAFNCPIPPRENHLQVAVRAGEKTYPH